MKRLFKFIMPILAIFIMAGFTGCTQNDTVTHNVQQQANYGITKRQAEKRLKEFQK